MWILFIAMVHGNMLGTLELHFDTKEKCLAFESEVVTKSRASGYWKPVKSLGCHNVVVE